jgi:hypothetical protein
MFHKWHLDNTHVPVHLSNLNKIIVMMLFIVYVLSCSLIHNLVLLDL